MRIFIFLLLFSRQQHRSRSRKALQNSSSSSRRDFIPTVHCTRHLFIFTSLLFRLCQIFFYLFALSVRMSTYFWALLSSNKLVCCVHCGFLSLSLWIWFLFSFILRICMNTHRFSTEEKTNDVHISNSSSAQPNKVRSLSLIKVSSDRETGPWKGLGKSLTKRRIGTFIDLHLSSTPQRDERRNVGCVGCSPLMLFSIENA